MNYLELSELMIESMIKDIFKVVNIFDRFITLRIYINNVYYIDLHRYRSSKDSDIYNSYHYELNEELTNENKMLISEAWVDNDIKFIDNVSQFKQDFFDFIFIVAQYVNEERMVQINQIY